MTLDSYLVLVLIVTILTNVTLVTIIVTQMKNALIQLEVTIVSMTSAVSNKIVSFCVG